MIGLAIVIYFVVGLIIARATATYYTEKFTLEKKYSKNKTVRALVTYEDWKKTEVDPFRFEREKPEEVLRKAYNTYMANYPNQKYREKKVPYYSYENNTETKVLVWSLPIVWLFLIIGYFPAKYSGKALRATVNKIDWVGKELANPRNNIKERA